MRSDGALGRDAPGAVGEDEEEARFGPGPDAPPSANPRLLRRLVRNALFRRVELLARENYDRLGELDGAAGWDASRWAQAMAGYWDEYDHLGIGPEARSSALVQIDTRPVEAGQAPGWRVTQVFDDPEGDRDWRLTATVDLPATDEAGVVVLTDLHLGPASPTG